MAYNEEDLNLFAQTVSGNHTALFLKLRQEGRAKMSQAGVEVCIVEKKGSNKIKIRSADDSWEMWTRPEAVQKKGVE